ncbi:MAG TPA: hypothetical protein VE467_07090, partial [Chryseolinea sp.]|nr:hypothetical protein [Chryseolinea sp.]
FIPHGLKYPGKGQSQDKRKGIAVAPVPLKKLTEQIFIDNVKYLLAHKLLYENAKRLSEKLQSEDGILNAIQKIESF